MSEATVMPASESRKNFIFIMIAMTIVSMIYSMQLTPMTLYIGELGGTEFHVGLIGGINFIIAMCFRPFSGFLSDTKGRQKVYVFGAAMYVIATLGYVMAPNITVLIIARAISGFGLCSCTTAQYAMIPDLYPKNTTRCFYIMAVLQTVASLFAPALGLQLANTIGYKSMYLITAGGFLVAFIFGCLVTYEKRYPHKWMESEQKKAPKVSDLFEKAALIPSICIMLHGIAHISIMSFIAPFGQSLGISNVGFWFTINSIASVIVAAALAKLIAPEYKNRMFFTGAAFMIATMACFVFAQNLSLMYVGAVLFAVGYNATQPILNAVALASAPEERKGAASAMFQMFWDFGFGVGSTVLGVVAANFGGYRSVYVAAIILIVVIMLLFATKLRNAKMETDEKGA